MKRIEIGARFRLGNPFEIAFTTFIYPFNIKDDRALIELLVSESLSNMRMIKSDEREFIFISLLSTDDRIANYRAKY